MEDVKITHEVCLDHLTLSGELQNSHRMLIPSLQEPGEEPELDYHALKFEWCVSSFSEFGGVLESCSFQLERCNVVWRFEMKFTKSQATSKDVVELEFVRNSTHFSPIQVKYVLSMENTAGETMGPFAGFVNYGSTTMTNVLAFGWRPSRPSEAAQPKKAGIMNLPDDILVIKGKLKFSGCCLESMPREDGGLYD